MSRAVSSALAMSLWILLSASFAHANSVDLLTFGGLKNGQEVANFYQSKFGITFSSGLIAYFPTNSVNGGPVGGQVNYTPLQLSGAGPNQDPAVFMTSNMGSINIASGFKSGLNFFYTSPFQDTVTVWSGANGTGTVLSSIALSGNDGSCAGGSGCNWSNVDITFKGTGGSITFSGPAGFGISDLTLGQGTTAVPESSSIYLLGTGLFGLCASQLRRFIGV
jgi:hypothetical protein